MNKKTYIGLLSLLFPLGMMAQTSKTLCDFETADSYASIGVYDTWADSPFRTSKLQGNVQVVNNHLNGVDATLGSAPNPSTKILGVQRSRFGSNTFGALVKLKEPFALSRTQRYIHVNVYTPKAANMMVIGLGNRDDRPWQSDLTEQFWAQPTTTPNENQWVDMVFPFSGADGITIRNLLIVVDANSTHDMTQDFACYIDNIVLSNKRDPAFSGTPYAINYSETTGMTRTDRYFNTLRLSTSDGEQTLAVNQSSTKKLYYKKLDNCFTAKVGTTITPKKNTNDMTTNWMCAYLYIDKGNDGSFDVDWDNNGVNNAGDLMSYSYYKEKSSLGAAVMEDGQPAHVAPAFTLPADLKPGIYRLRYKIDWDCVDPGGNDMTTNKIDANGGVIVDTRINIHNDKVNLSRGTDDLGGGLNGSIELADGSAITGKQVPFNKAFTFKPAPAPGFEFDRVVIRHGYNLNREESSIFGNKQWEELTVTASQLTNGQYTLPASVVDGDIRFTPYFKNKPVGIETTEVTEKAFTWTAGAGEITLHANAATHVVVADIQGKVVFNDNVEGVKTVNLAKGLYIVNGEKALVK